MMLLVVVAVALTWGLITAVAFCPVRSRAIAREKREAKR